MKNTILIIIASLSIHPIFSQDEIYKGGVGDGWASASYQQVEQNIFTGGIGDGWASLNLQQLESNIFNGGVGDGWAKDDTTFQLAVSVIENKFGAAFVAWPNPTSGELNIDLGDVFQDLTLTIYSVTGKLMDEKKFVAVSQMKFEIEGGAGLYFVKVNSGANEATIKVIKD